MKMGVGMPFLNCLQRSGMQSSKADESSIEMWTWLRAEKKTRIHLVDSLGHHGHNPGHVRQYQWFRLGQIRRRRRRRRRERSMTMWTTLQTPSQVQTHVGFHAIHLGMDVLAVLTEQEKVLRRQWQGCRCQFHFQSCCRVLYLYIDISPCTTHSKHQLVHLFFGWTIPVLSLQMTVTSSLSILFQPSVSTRPTCTRCQSTA
mmetsp:Transcript_9902/g.22866  ORF Transcript_9902/g.22866 Transcript_9902/m.22866 type:complete len:201 (+) Transcript_9902:298-900(+)